MTVGEVKCAFSTVARADVYSSGSSNSFNLVCSAFHFGASPGVANTCGSPPQPVYLANTAFSSAVAGRTSASHFRNATMAATFCPNFCRSEPSPSRSASVSR